MTTQVNSSADVDVQPVVLSTVQKVSQPSLTSEVIIGYFEIPADNVGNGTMYAFKAMGVLGFPDGQTITVNVRIGASSSHPLANTEIMSTGDFTTTTHADARLYSIDGTVYIGEQGDGTAMGFINESASSSSPPPGGMSRAHPCGATFSVAVAAPIYIVITTQFTKSSNKNEAGVQNGILERVG
jgi:hypothetical protein